ncbi:NAD(P)-binding protein [Aspergillus saccharolyticus JOP 1030-1]|uniref:NAD(P)-binding protein n=1 Tax=Aspergillus saccharolyticus JOP 1030-1 TaxID=1450539 RepID=A0A318ZIG5_9EURO|nr:NAD(P)-binding protein [Aspergillus saccharolyticus JOP 1030-1]PYH46715.1 NAD(P)-binding protein [Aspergillus saccharolyticus JOP 1030-1]
MAVTFDITPECEASKLHFLYRQFFLAAPVVSRKEVDLTGQVAIVTGATVGLGLETARQLLDLNCQVILAVRDLGRGEQARRNLLQGRSPTEATEQVSVWALDLDSYESIQGFAARTQTLPHLDIAVLNAGVYKVDEQFHATTHFEEGVQINYLANVLLLTLLLPVLYAKRRAPDRPGRLVLVNSDTAAWSVFREGRGGRGPLLPAFQRPMQPAWNMQERYGVSKLLGQFFLVELTKRVAASAVTVTSANCGMCYGSSIGRDGVGRLEGYVWAVVSRILGRSCAVGARTFVHAATRFGPEIHGQYLEDARLRPLAPIIYRPEGVKIAGVLWEETMEELSFAGVREIVEEMSKLK